MNEKIITNKTINSGFLRGRSDRTLDIVGVDLWENGASLPTLRIELSRAGNSLVVNILTPADYYDILYNFQLDSYDISKEDLYKGNLKLKFDKSRGTHYVYELSFVTSDESKKLKIVTHFDALSHELTLEALYESSLSGEAHIDDFDECFTSELFPTSAVPLHYFCAPYDYVEYFIDLATTKCVPVTAHINSNNETDPRLAAAGCALLKTCDKVYVCGSYITENMAREIAFAREHNVPLEHITDANIDDLLKQRALAIDLLRKATACSDIDISDCKSLEKKIHTIIKSLD